MPTLIRSLFWCVIWTTVAAWPIVAIILSALGFTPEVVCVLLSYWLLGAITGSILTEGVTAAIGALGAGRA